MGSGGAPANAEDSDDLEAELAGAMETGPALLPGQWKASDGSIRQTSAQRQLTNTEVATLRSLYDSWCCAVGALSRAQAKQELQRMERMLGLVRSS